LLQYRLSWCGLTCDGSDQSSVGCYCKRDIESSLSINRPCDRLHIFNKDFAPRNCFRRISVHDLLNLFSVHRDSHYS
jgi:hypothetical protein